MFPAAGHLPRRLLAFRTGFRSPTARLLTKDTRTFARQNIGLVHSPNTTCPEAITREQLLAKLSSTPAEEFLLVDVRGVDHEGGTIRGSLNLPSHSLEPAVPTLYTICKAANVRTIIWYCGSSKGRGPRAARLFRDYIVTQEGPDMWSLVLQDGVKGWVKAGGNYTEWMDNYDAAKWESVPKLQTNHDL